MLPLPIAQLLRRARNAKSPKERHDTAFFAWEASVRLCAAAGPPSEPLALTHPSLGQWLAALRPGSAAFREPTLLAVYRLFTEVGLGKASGAASVTAVRLLEPLAAYRNRVIGHGSVRTGSFYEDAGKILCEGLVTAWDEGVLLPLPARIVYLESLEVGDAGDRRGRALDLDGLGSVALVLTGVDVGELVPGRVYCRGGHGDVSLHPWLLYDGDDLRERVLFFNGGGRHPRYLDFVSGEEVRLAELSTRFPRLVEEWSDLFGTTADRAEPEVAADASRFGDYRILGKLGEGGMGVVYLARQEALGGRPVALKMIRGIASDDAVALARFRREITALGRCDHPNVVRILASGKVGEVPYYAMELVEGPDLDQLRQALPGAPDFDAALTTAAGRSRALRDELLPDAAPVTVRRLERGGGDTTRMLTSLFRDGARALEHLHGHGVLHRDVKPGNLIVTAADGRLVLMDLGLAAFADGTHSLTRDSHGILGTLRYMSPEQLQRKLVEVDQRADVYGLGATFYELLTRRAFFDGDTEARLVEQVLREEPVAPERVNPRLPRDLCTILVKATSKDPRRRYSSASALADDLDAVLDGRPISARPATLSYVLGLALRRHWGVALSALVLVLLVVAGTVAFVVRERALRFEADRFRRLAEVREAEVRAATVGLLEAQGSAALEAGDSERAARLLYRAYASGTPSPTLRFLLAEAMQAVETPAVTLRGHGAPVTSAAFTPGGARLLTGDASGVVIVWDWFRAKRLASLRGHQQPIRRIAFEGNQLAITAAGDEPVVVWDLDTATELARLAHDEPVIEIDPRRGRLVTLSASGAVRLWELPAGALKFTLPTVPAPVERAYLEVDRVVTVDSEGNQREYDLETGKEIPVPKRDAAPGTESSSGSVLAAREGWQVTARDDGSVRLVRSGAPSARTREGRLVNLAGTASPLVALGSTLLDARGRFPILDWEGVNRENEEYRFETVSPDGRWLLLRNAPSREAVFAVVDARSGLLRSRFSGALEPDPSCPAVFSPDGELIAACSGRDHVGLWSAASGEALRELDDVRRDLQFENDGRHVVGHAGTEALRIAVATGRVVQRFPHDAPVTSASLSRYGRRLVTSALDGVARLWDVAEGTLVRSYLGHQKAVYRAVLSPDGSVLATAGLDRTARLWDVSTGRLRATLPHEDIVLAVAFAPDGLRLATAGDEDQIRIWDVRSGRLLARRQQPGGVLDLAFSADGAYLSSSDFLRYTRTRETASYHDVGLEERSAAEVRGVLEKLGVGVEPDP